MRRLIILITVTVLTLIVSGIFLIQNLDARQLIFLPNLIEGAESLQIPFIFAIVIVGFSVIAFQRINE